MTHVIDRLQRIVAAQPAAIAIAVAGEPALTYAALWQRAGAVSAALQPGELVALHVERSAEFVVGMIASWIAGAAWVPVLPELPEARRQLIVDETRARVALVADRPPAWLAERCRIVDLRDAAGEPLARTRSIEDRAYVIYTSGSTGQPKGVVVSHRGLVPMLDAQLAAFELSASARCLWMLSPGFDASVSDVCTALLAGATLHLEHPARLRDGLLATIRQRGITHVDLPPSLLPLLPADQAPPCLRTIIVGGEVCAPAAIRAWAERVRVVNVYGPTEATVCTSLIACDSSWDRPLLGAPLPHVELAVVDDELWITGAGLADGYLARPELDAAKFVQRDGRRWFRTGDRVRVHDDGLELVGRIDRQLKIAGVLVAPEEIEARLREHPRVTDAHVVAEQVGTRTRLVAYYGADEELVDLRDHLARHLDARLVPARFVHSELASTGKRAPRRLASETATVVAGLWERLLGVVPALEDDFFALGGDSLAAIEHVGLAELAGLQMTAEMLYEHRTLEALVAALEHEAPASVKTCTELIIDVAELRETQRALRRASRDLAIEQDTSILLTGATGFLGARVLVELVAQARVTCCVRDPSALISTLRDVVGGERAIAAMSSHLRVVAGDLTKPQLGLPDAVYEQLARTTSAIVHCAADVSLAKPYHALRATNVIGTARVLELAALAGARVHHASTLSVFVGSDRQPGTLHETDALETAERVYGGYAQSKWAAEWLAREAGASIYRFGLLTGETSTGRASARDWLTWFVRGLAQIGAVPRGEGDLAVDVTPIDHASHVLAALVLDDARGTFHVANRRSATLAELAAALRRTGISVAEVDPLAWPDVVAAAHLAAPEAAAAVLGLCRGTDRYARLRTCDVFQATGHAFDTSRTDEVARCPPPTAELLDRYVAAALEAR